MLLKEDVEEFRNLFKQKYGIELSYIDAEREANNLLSLYKAVLSVKLRKNENRY